MKGTNIGESILSIQWKQKQEQISYLFNKKS